MDIKEILDENTIEQLRISEVIGHDTYTEYLQDFLESLNYYGYTIVKKDPDKWTKDKIRNWLIDVYTLTDSSDKLERKEGIRQLMYLIDELKKEK